jgi:hypothetical protein
MFRGEGAFFSITQDGEATLNYMGENDYLWGVAYGAITGAVATMKTVKLAAKNDARSIRPEIFSPMLLLSTGICYRADSLHSDKHTALQNGDAIVGVPLEYGMQCLTTASEPLLRK